METRESTSVFSIMKQSEKKGGKKEKSWKNKSRDKLFQCLQKLPFFIAFFFLSTFFLFLSYIIIKTLAYPHRLPG